MSRFRTGNSAKDRRNRECDGYRNWDTAASVIVIRNDRKCRELIRNSGDTLLGMKKQDKLRLLERKSENGFGGVSFRNVDYRALNAEIKRLKNQ